MKRVLDNFTKKDIQKIVSLLIEKEQLEKIKYHIVYEQCKHKPSPYNDFSSDRYLEIKIPFVKNDNIDIYAFYFRIYEDGFCTLVNGLDVKMRFSNAKKKNI